MSWKDIFNQRHTREYLDPEYAQNAKQAYRTIASDATLHVKCVTFTFKPKYKTKENHIVFSAYRDRIHKFLRCLPYPFYIKLYPEMHEDYTIHFHGIIAGNPTSIEKYYKWHIRNWAHAKCCKIKEPTKMSTWLDYCTSQGEYSHKEPMSLISKLGTIEFYKIKAKAFDQP